MPRIGIIGGSGVYTLLEKSKQVKVETPYGAVTEARVGSIGGVKVAFLPRHGSGHNVPPHRVNYRANVAAMAELGVERLLATTAVGSCNPQMGPGDLAVLDQFIDLSKSRAYTFYEGDDGRVIHIDLTTPYCPELCKVLYKEARRASEANVFPKATYACFEGPRFETPAEINAARTLGADVVGMTNVPEVVLAREKQICYAAIALVTNPAAGMASKPLSSKEVVELMDRNLDLVKRIFASAVARIPESRSCSCGSALKDAGM